jgi:uncharacterized membrane protein (UPF0136 family)
MVGRLSHPQLWVVGWLLMSLSNPDFNARVARISAGTGSSKSTIFVGLDEAYQVTYRRRGKAAGPVAAVGNTLMSVFFVIAVGLGALAFGIATWIRFQLMGQGAGVPDPMTEMAIQAGAALAVAFIIARAVPFRARMLKIVMAISAVCTMFVYHNAVHIFPDTFAQVFSQSWVDLVRATTKPLSIVWQGRSFTF